uniref:Mechanosensitive ion channel MscS C-terminal domain-containing protein n=1 Tax=candidate division WOR-3 bacterium TaxID=2052148 RepID=A0A7C4XG24_UNCW3
MIILLHKEVSGVGADFLINNLYFLLIIIGAILFVYILAIFLNNLRRTAGENNQNIGSIVEILSFPFLVFILSSCYGIGFLFLKLPSSWKDALSATPAIVLIISGMAFIFNIISFILKVGPNLKIKRIIQTTFCGFCIGILIYCFYKNLAGLIFSLALSAVFFFVVYKFLKFRKIAETEKPVITGQLVITHIYPSSAVFQERIKEAMEIIKEAISETPGTGEVLQILASDFTPRGIDLQIKYYITDRQNFDEVKSKVNLNIIKKLNERNIKLTD